MNLGILNWKDSHSWNRLIWCKLSLLISSHHLANRKKISYGQAINGSVQICPKNQIFDFLFFYFFNDTGFIIYLDLKKKGGMTHEMISNFLCENEISINCIKVDLIMGQLLAWCSQKKIGSFLILYFSLDEIFGKLIMITKTHLR